MPNSNTNFDNLTIANDFMFKHVMLKPHLCKHLLEEILQQPIAELTYVEMEKTIDPYYDSRGIRLDIIVADSNNTHYNLEMQVRNLLTKQNNDPIIAKRTRYYQSILDVNMLQKGQDFDDLPPSFIIFICPYDAFKDEQRIYTFKKRCLQNLDLELNYDYVNNNIVSNDFTKNIAETIVELKQDKKVRLAYMTYETHLRDAQYEAKAEGKHEEKLDTARRLLNMHLSIQDIAKATMLSIAEIKQLQKEMFQSI